MKIKRKEGGCSAGAITCTGKRDRQPLPQPSSCYLFGWKKRMEELIDMVGWAEILGGHWAGMGCRLPLVICCSP